MAGNGLLGSVYTMFLKPPFWLLDGFPVLPGLECPRLFYFIFLSYKSGGWVRMVRTWNCWISFSMKSLHINSLTFFCRMTASGESDFLNDSWFSPGEFKKKKVPGGLGRSCPSFYDIAIEFSRHHFFLFY